MAACPQSVRLVPKFESAAAKADEADDEESTKARRILNKSVNFWLDALTREGFGCEVQSADSRSDYQH